MAKRYSPCMSCIPRRKLSMLPAPGRRMRRARRSRNWTSFSSPWARAWDGHEVVDLAVGRLALHYAEENPDEVVAALDDKTEAVIRERLHRSGLDKGQKAGNLGLNVTTYVGE